MDQKMYHCAEVHNREKAVYFWEKAQTFFKLSKPHNFNAQVFTPQIPFFGPKKYNIS